MTTDVLPEVRLRQIEERDLELLERWLNIPDVRDVLELPGEVNRHHVKVWIFSRRLEVLMIDDADGTSVGFYLVYFAGYKRTNTREFDIAVPEARQKGVAKAAIRALEEWAFDQQELSGVWAKIFADNKPCIELVRACGWPLSEPEEGLDGNTGEPRDVVWTRMTPELRVGITERRGF
jgi:RimJ/RimL family protein N-acetyltransferase